MQDKTMKEQLLEFIDKLEADNFDFDENFAVIKFSYKERPWYIFELIINREDQLDLPLQ